MSTSMTENDRRSLIGANQAANAVAELLRFHSEGPASDRAFGDVEAVCLLAEALKLACEIEVDLLEQMRSQHPSILEEISELGQLQAACAKFIEGWAG